MSVVTSHSWALVTGNATVELKHATPLPRTDASDEGQDGHSGDVVSLEANVAQILVGSGMADYVNPWGPAKAAAPGKMFRTGERKPYDPAPAPAAAAVPAAAAPAPAHAKK